MVTQRVWERKAQTGRHISLPLWHILQGNRSQTAWCWLSLTCYESIAGRGLSITLGGGSWGERTARRAGGGWAWAKQPCCMSLIMHHCMTANLVWLVHNGRSKAWLYEQSFPAPPSQLLTRGGKSVGGVCVGGGGIKTHRTDISLTLSLEALTASGNWGVNICSVSHWKPFFNALNSVHF